MGPPINKTRILEKNEIEAVYDKIKKNCNKMRLKAASSNLTA